MLLVCADGIPYSRKCDILSLKRYEPNLEYMYNVLGKLSSVMAPAPGLPTLEKTEAAKYVYLADGTKIGVSLPDGSETMYRGPFILHRDAAGDVELQTLILPEGIAVPDQNSLKMYIFVSDRLGSIRAVVDLGEREVCEENDYYVFGSRIPGGEQLIENRWRYSGKEEQETLSDLPYIDFGARLYNPRLGRWNAIDPLAHKYFGMSPYNYCGNDPVNFFDPDGNAWLPITNEGGELDYLWIPEEKSYNEDGSLKEGLYHQAILFIDNHSFKKDYNLGSSTAVVYKADGSIEEFDACTVPSDDKKYPTVPAGRYEAAVGTHTGSSGKGYTALKMFDVGKSLKKNTISLGEPNVAHPDKNYIKGADIHKAGKNDFTGVGRDGSPVSAACFLISKGKWDSFIGLFNNNEQKNNVISISVRRRRL